MQARIAIPLLVAATASVLSTAPPASAGYDCDASALRTAVLGGAAVEPLVVNRGAGRCQTASMSLAPANLPLLSGQAAVAATSVTGDSPATEKVLATGGVVNLTVKALPELPISLPVPQVPDSLGAVEVPLLGVPALLDPLLPSSVTLDLRPAVTALLPDGKLPAVDVVNVGAALAYAAGACTAGRASLAGASQVSGIRALGQELPVNAVVDQAFTLVDSSSIDLANLDLSKVALPSFVGVAGSVLRPIVEASLVPVLAALPDIAVPAALAQVKITPGEQVRSAGRLTQRALRVQVSVAGRSLTDLVLGEASVSESGVDCSTGEAAAATADATDLALACTTRRLVLTDVIASGRRVKLLGAADKALAGATVSIRLLATGRTVATARVGADGAFSATAPLPPRSIRSGNRARYQATVGSERSLDLKLARRMIVTSMRADGDRVTITGRVTGPLARPIAPIFVERRVSCDDTEHVGQVTPRRDGTFRISVAAPEGAAAAVYRLTTRVRKKASSPKTFPTYTLPRAVNLH